MFVNRIFVCVWEFLKKEIIFYPHKLVLLLTWCTPKRKKATTDLTRKYNFLNSYNFQIWVLSVLRSAFWSSHSHSAIMSGSGNFLLFLFRAKKIQYSGIEFFYGFVYTNVFVRSSLAGQLSHSNMRIKIQSEKN